MSECERVGIAREQQRTALTAAPTVTGGSGGNDSGNNGASRQMHKQQQRRPRRLQRCSGGDSALPACTNLQRSYELEVFVAVLHVVEHL